jgi:hypothetical protein
MKHRIPTKSTSLSPSDFRILKDLKSKFIFHPTDKSAQDFAITCKAFYYANLSEYDTTKTYHALPADTVPASLTSKHLKFTSSLNLSIPSSLASSTHLIPYAVQDLKSTQTLSPIVTLPHHATLHLNQYLLSSPKSSKSLTLT